jgi:hypothetical protein
LVRTFWVTPHACLVRSERLHDLAITAASVILMLAIASGDTGTGWSKGDRGARYRTRRFGHRVAVAGCGDTGTSRMRSAPWR